MTKKLESTIRNRSDRYNETGIKPLSNNNGAISTVSKDHRGFARAGSVKMSLQENGREENEQFYREIFNTFIYGMLVFEIDNTGIPGEIYKVNDALCEKLGYTKEELFGLAFKDIIFVEVNKGLSNLTERLLKKRYATVEACLLSKNGYPIPCEISGRLSTMGRKEFIVLIIRDITAEKRMKKELRLLRGLIRDAQEIEKNGFLVKDRFFARMSHELLTPLTSIIGFSEFLAGLHAGPLNDLQEEYIKDIVESGKHLLSQIKDILELSSTETDRKGIKITRIPMKKVIMDSIDIIKDAANRQGIHVAFFADENIPKYIRSDQSKIEQILFKLLSNALKFTPQGGEICVRVRRTPNGEGGWHLKSGDFIEIAVEASGVGIPPEHHRAIFENFYQVNNAIGDKTSGTGLGLSVCKRFLEMLNGEIRAEIGRQDRGCCFYVLLPLK